MRLRGRAQYIAAVLAAGIGITAAHAQGQVTLTHVHGLSYSADGAKLMIPSHHGLAVHEQGRWHRAPGPQHDFMGFSATAHNFYSSGHPAPGSGAINPLGLIRSRDGGRTWDKLGLEGESDFHFLAAGWNSNVIYVWNPAPNSRMRKAGLHVSGNDGLAWKRVGAAKLAGDPRSLAVHPDDRTGVAVATTKGIFLSRDAGEHFTALVTGGDGLSVHFDLDGAHLWYGSFDGRARLTRAALAGGASVRFGLPPIGHDAVAFIAQNPRKRSEYAIATFARNVFLSRDGGATWIALAELGTAK